MLGVHKALLSDKFSAVLQICRRAVSAQKERVIKKSIISCILFISTIVISFDSYSENVGNLKEKYCGSGWSFYVVPDSFLGCTFTEACRKHDVCYGRCDKNGDLYGGDYCAKSKKSQERQENKKACDLELKKEIIRINGDSKLCNKFSGLYEFSVRKFGGSAFNGLELPDWYLKVIDSSSTKGEVIKKITYIQKLKASGHINIKDIRFDLNKIRVLVKGEIKAPFKIENNWMQIPNNLDAQQLKQLQLNINR